MRAFTVAIVCATLTLCTAAGYYPVPPTKPCEKVQCDANSKCVVEEDGTAICVPNGTPSPPTPEPTTTTQPPTPPPTTTTPPPPPSTQPPIVCEKNEVYKECGTACPVYCSNNTDSGYIGHLPPIQQAPGQFDPLTQFPCGDLPYNTVDCDQYIGGQLLVCDWSKGHYGYCVPPGPMMKRSLSSNEQTACSAVCIPNTCDCAPGFVRSDETCECIRIDQCPPPTTTPEPTTTTVVPKCDIYEELKECGTACQPTCANRTYEQCSEQCISNQCECIAGYIRSEVNQKCIPITECPKVCGVNEHVEQCGTACQPSCADPEPRCSKDCVNNQCECDEGFIRSDDSKICIPKTDCPAPPTTKKPIVCEENEEYKECGTPCPKTCTTPANINCPTYCVKDQCECKAGYVRIGENKKCILETECPVPTTTTVAPEVPEITTTVAPEVPEITTTIAPEVPEITTTVAPEVPELTTTKAPEVPEITTTVAPEVPEPTTTVAPEVPEITTTVAPEVPEPTTTVAPEVPEPTTTVAPEVPEITTTVAPEVPEPTTTVAPEVPEITTTKTPEAPVTTPSTKAPEITPEGPSCKTVKCEADHHCEIVDGQPECVEDPCCDGTTCPTGSHCEMREVQCITTPCYPVPTCVCDSNSTCDSTKCAEDEHCQIVSGLPKCVKNPCCEDTKCEQGQVCQMTQTDCPTGKDCYLKPICVSIYGKLNLKNVAAKSVQENSKEGA